MRSILVGLIAVTIVKNCPSNALPHLATTHPTKTEYQIWCGPPNKKYELCDTRKEYCDLAMWNCQPCSSKCFGRMDYFQELECKQECAGYLNAQAKLEKAATDKMTIATDLPKGPSQDQWINNSILKYEKLQFFGILAAVACLIILIIIVLYVVRLIKKHLSNTHRSYSCELHDVTTEQKQPLVPDCPPAPNTLARMDDNDVDIHKNDIAKNKAPSQRSIETSEKDHSSPHPQERDAGLGKPDDVTNQTIMHPEQI